MATSTTSLQFALQCIRLIETRIASTNGQLTKHVFSQSQIGSATLETTRESIGLNFQSVIQNVRALKRNDPILQQYPNIQWNIQNSVSRRNWLAHEYGTTAPIKWNEVADSVYDDLPVMKSSIIAALQANGIANP
jgi:hypothetical protein